MTIDEIMKNLTPEELETFEHKEEPESVVLPRHFEKVVRGARKSISDKDLYQYSKFAENLHQSRAQLGESGSSLYNFKFPKNINGSSSEANLNTIQENMEEDLYS